MLVQIQIVAEVLEREGELAALRSAARLACLGKYRDPIQRGLEAMSRPDFYRSIGQDPDCLFDLGVRALRAIIEENKADVQPKGYRPLAGAKERVMRTPKNLFFSETESSTAVADAAPAAKKPVKKKAATKKAPAATTKKSPKKAAKKEEKAPVKKAERAKKDGLGKAQRAVLTALSKASRPLTRTQIGEKTGINSGFTSLLGHLDPANREPQSLGALGFIKIEKDDVDGRDVVVHSITAAGKKALEKDKAAK